MTWLAVIASVCMGLAAVCAFVYAVKKDYFRNIEDAKYQVFWGDSEDRRPPLPPNRQENHNASGSECAR